MIFLIKTDAKIYFWQISKPDHHHLVVQKQLLDLRFLELMFCANSFNFFLQSIYNINTSQIEFGIRRSFSIILVHFLITN